MVAVVTAKTWPGKGDLVEVPQPATAGFNIASLLSEGHLIFPALHPHVASRIGKSPLFEPPSWVKKIVVTGDAGFCANETLRLIHNKGWIYVFAMSRTRKFTNGKYVRDLVCHLPRHCYSRRATYTPDGRRRDFWVFQRRATLNQLGDVKVTIKELKSGLHLGQMQVTRDKDRVKRSVALSVCAYLLLARLYGRDESLSSPWSLFRLKQRFTAEMARAQCDRIETRWQHKLLKLKEAA